MTMPETPKQETPEEMEEWEKHFPCAWSYQGESFPNSGHLLAIGVCGSRKQDFWADKKWYEASPENKDSFRMEFDKWVSRYYQGDRETFRLGWKARDPEVSALKQEVEGRGRPDLATRMVIGDLHDKLEKAAAIIESKDREISRLRQEQYTDRGKLNAAREALGFYAAGDGGESEDLEQVKVWPGMDIETTLRVPGLVARNALSELDRTLSQEEKNV